MPDIFRMRSELNIKKKIPGFIHVRRKLYDDLSPKVHMKYVYIRKSDETIEVVHCTVDPGNQYPKALYIKLYEEAHVKVIFST